MDKIKKDWYLFIGTAVFLFEGLITLLVPLQEAVATYQDKLKFVHTLRVVITAIVAFYAFFGIVCWTSFGDDVNTVLTTSLPDGLIATTVQLAYSVAVLFTFPLQNFPALEILSRASKPVFKRVLGGSGKVTSKRRAAVSSLAIVLLSQAAVALTNDLDHIVSLIGAFFGIPMAFIIPTMMHSKLCDPSPGRKVLNKCVVILGLVTMVAASTVTVISWNAKKEEER